MEGGSVEWKNKKSSLVFSEDLFCFSPLFYSQCAQQNFRYESTMLLQISKKCSSLIFNSSFHEFDLRGKSHDVNINCAVVACFIELESTYELSKVRHGCIIQKG